jgi:PelA/Pel-15E family pectate lyase
MNPARIIYILLFLSVIAGTVESRAQVKLDHLSWSEVIYSLPDAWYGSHEALQVAENVLLYQRDIGGWPKDIAMHLRLTGSEKKALRKLQKTGKGATIDNGATSQELLFLSKVYGKTGSDSFRSAFLKGVDYLIEAQYENGGWPQSYPLEEGDYSTHITYNDNAMVNAMKVMKHIAERSDLYTIQADDATIMKAQYAFEKGINCILRTQYRQDEVLTAWCAQHDEHTFEPVKARSYELPSLSGAESAGIVLLLMSIDNPSPGVLEAVESAVSWFDRVRIKGIRVEYTINDEGEEDRRVIRDKDAPDIWARFYDLDNNTPFFSDRDGIRKETLADLSQERRGGYAWYKYDPQTVLDEFENWRKTNSRRKLPHEVKQSVENFQSMSDRTRYNILFLISDDMNDWIGCMGGHPDAITPNLDRLAERAVLFRQAHCSAPICNPSRASVMSGLNPSTTGCYGNRQALRMSPVGFEAVTLPRYFSNHGYYSSGVGKITHGKFPDPASWDDFFPNLRSQGMDGATPPQENMNGLNNSNFDWGPLDVADSAMKDGKITRHIIEMLANDYSQPFFLACGWKLPHLAWHAPREYFNLYDPGKIAMPLTREDDLEDLPPAALRYTENSYYRSVSSAGKEAEGVQAYLACISFIDAQVGLVLDALDSSRYADNTIVVFWGDHGWHLGEKRHWSKSTLWEESTRAPLMIAVPGMQSGICDTPVSFLDIYPSLLELAGLEPNPDLDGKSLVPLMKDPGAVWDWPALTTHGKGNHSLRTKRWRYTRYSNGDEELYDHSIDEMEWENLAGDTAYMEIKEKFKRWLPVKDAEDVHVLQWPQEEKLYWEATLKAAERYHGKSVYPENWTPAK